MKNVKEIKLRIAQKRFLNKIKRKRLKKCRRRQFQKDFSEFAKKYKHRSNTKAFSIEDAIDQWLPPNISFLLNSFESDFHQSKLRKNIPKNNGVFRVPKQFTIIDKPKESFRFLQQLTAALVYQTYPRIRLDYNECERADLGAQILLDIILMDIIKFYKKCNQSLLTTPKVHDIGGINVNNEVVRKLLFSVGSPAILNNNSVHFDDIIPYKLCIHDREKHGDPLKIREQKDIDTTTLVDYVLECLSRLNREITPEKLDDLCTVIGETLINAEEHSTTKYRFSIGYFQETKNDGKHLGLFRLVILNFGKTIYEKFKDPECPNKDIILKMKNLSESYSKRNIFLRKEFEEETLWTLYALQEGVTTIAPEVNRKRGNGSIQFIESFFNIKGIKMESDSVSKLTILSGNTNITFDGTYNIIERPVNGENFKYMTFNESGNIEDKPDAKYVKFVENYFPGTIINAKILFNEDDFTNEAQ